MAEETAWNYVKEHKEFDVVVINPSFILGPVLSKRLDIYPSQFLCCITTLFLANILQMQ